MSLDSNDFGKYTLAEKQTLINLEKRLMLQEQIELTVLMPKPPNLTTLWFNAVIQLGYMSFFSLAFPIAPIWGILINVLHVNLNFWTMGNSIQRIPANESEDIGIWEDIIYVYSLLALIVNSGVLLFSCQGVFVLVGGDSASSVTLYNVTIGLILIENAFFVFKFMLAALIPDCPKWVKKEKQKRERKQEFQLEIKIIKKEKKMTSQFLNDNNILELFNGQRTGKNAFLDFKKENKVSENDFCKNEDSVNINNKIRI